MSVQKLALIMSSDYYGENQLAGCINDAEDIVAFLERELLFDPSNITKLYDEKMTRKGMLKELGRLADQALAITRTGRTPALFLYYSGHGTQTTDDLKIEEDQQAEALVPWDFDTAELVKDYEVYRTLIGKLPANAQLFVFTDCCNSGTNLNLKYSGIHEVYQRNTTDASVIGLSGCSDSQTSAETNGHGVATQAFLKLMKSKKIQTIPELRVAMSDVSIPFHQQTPEVSVSRREMIYAPLFPWMLGNNDEQNTQKQLRRLVMKHKFGVLGHLVAGLFQRD